MPSTLTSSHVGGQEYRVSYLPAESDTGMFGGNSNWRGPIWMPVNALIIRALLNYYAYYGNDFTVECPTGSGQHMNLYQVAEEIARRLAQHLSQGRRTAAARSTAEREKFQEDPHWRDCMLVLRILPRRQRRGPRRQPSDRLDGHHRPLHAFVCHHTSEQMLELGKKSGCLRSASGMEQAAWPTSRWTQERRESCSHRLLANDSCGTEQREHEHEHSMLSFALSDQYARLADRIVRVSLGRAATLDDIPDAELDRLAEMGFDWVWLLSVWQTGPAGQQVSRSNAEWRQRV